MLSFFKSSSDACLPCTTITTAFLELSLYNVCVYTAVGILLFGLGPYFFSNSMPPKTTLLDSPGGTHQSIHLPLFGELYVAAVPSVHLRVDYYRLRHRVVGLHPTHLCISTTNRAVCVSCVLQNFSSTTLLCCTNIYEVWTDTAVVVPGSELEVSLISFIFMFPSVIFVAGGCNAPSVQHSTAAADCQSSRSSHPGSLACGPPEGFRFYGYITNCCASLLLTSVVPVLGWRCAAAAGGWRGRRECQVLWVLELSSTQLCLMP